MHEADLTSRRKRHRSKLETAVRLRKETALSVKQIAARLDLDTLGSAGVCLLAAMTKAAPAPLSKSSWESEKTYGVLRLSKGDVQMTRYLKLGRDVRMVAERPCSLTPGRCGRKNRKGKPRVAWSGFGFRSPRGHLISGW